MKIETKKIILKDGKEVAQITTMDERWYLESVKDKEVYYPSSSWISSYYPKGIAYYKWLANKGWDEAEELKSLAGERGSKIHQAIDLLIKGQELKIDDKFENYDKGTQEELTPDEWEAVMSFVEWNKVAKPEYLANEYTVINRKDNYAGTVDIKAKIRDKLYIIDIKTSQYIWPSHKIQTSSYKHADGDKDINLAILQVGYRLNKNKYKFTDIEDKYDLFLSARKIWEEENKDVAPKQREFPTTLKL